MFVPTRSNRRRAGKLALKPSPEFVDAKAERMADMKLSRLFVFVCVVAVGLSPAIAQERPRLLFEVTQDGSVVARPEMRVPFGGEGRLELEERHGGERVTFTPTVRGDDIAIAYNISSGGKQFRSILVVTNTTPGFVEWTSSAAGQTFRLTISRVQ
jgi:hypothetical protein